MATLACCEPVERVLERKRRTEEREEEFNDLFSAFRPSPPSNFPYDDLAGGERRRTMRDVDRSLQRSEEAVRISSPATSTAIRARLACHLSAMPPPRCQRLPGPASLATGVVAPGKGEKEKTS